MNKQTVSWPAIRHIPLVRRAGTFPKKNSRSAPRATAGGAMLRHRSLGLLSLVALAVAGCQTIHSGGYENYMPAAAVRQVSAAATEESAAATRMAVVEHGPHGGKSILNMRTNLMSLSLRQALLLGLANNPALVVQRFNPSIAQTQIDAQRGLFDPQLTFSAQEGRNRVPGSGGYSNSDAGSGQVGLSENLPTGTAISANASSNIGNGGNGQTASTNVTLGVTQALLQGASVEVNLAAIHQAEIGKTISDYQLRALAISTVAQIVTDYWAYALARENVRILTDAYNVALQQEHQTRELIRVGRTAQSELPAAVAQAAVTDQQLLAADGALLVARLNLLELIMPPGSPFWNDNIKLLNKPYVPHRQLSPLKLHTALAMRISPVINESRLQIEQGNLSVVQTRDGLLPKLDLFITLGKTGYAAAFSRSVDQLNGQNFGVVGGIDGSYPIFNRTAQANFQGAELSRDQDQAALANLVQTVQLSVRTGYINCQTAYQQIAATRATRVAQAEALRATIGQFRVGESTSLLVAQAQSNLLSARLAEAQAVVNYLDARANLYLQEGSLLERLSLTAPGEFPVHADGPAWLRRWPNGYFH